MTELSNEQFRVIYRTNAKGEQKKVAPSPSHHTKNTLWTPGQRAFAVSNVEAGWENATSEQREEGSQFFPVWNKDAIHLGNALRSEGLSHPDAAVVHVGSSLLAHLSPKNEAEKNRIQGYELTTNLVNHGFGPWDKHLAQLKDALEKRNDVERTIKKGLDSGKIKRNDEEHLRLKGIAAGHQATIDLHRLKLGIAYVDDKGQVQKTPLADIGTRELGSAIDSVRHPAPLTTLDLLKRRDFGENISDPNEYKGIMGRTGHTVDTHMHDLVTGWVNLDYEHPRGLDAKNRYGIMGDVIEEARQNVAPEVGRSTFMASTWVQHRARKAAANPDSRSRQSAETQLRRITSTAQFKGFLPPGMEERYASPSGA